MTSPIKIIIYEIHENIVCLYDIYKISFIPTVVGEWSAISKDLRNSEKASALKTFLDREKSQEKDFKFGEEKKSDIHTGIRNNVVHLTNSFISEIL